MVTQQEQLPHTIRCIFSSLSYLIKPVFVKDLASLALIGNDKKHFKQVRKTLNVRLWYARKLCAEVTILEISSYVGMQQNVSPLETCGTFKKVLVPTAS